MTDRAARRASLLARIREDRERIALGLRPLAGAADYADRGWRALRWVRARPLVVVAAVAAGTALSFAGKRRRGIPVSLVKLGLGAWQSWRWLARALATPKQKQSAQ